METAHSNQDILLIEDNPGDVTLLARAFHKVGYKKDLHVARDGVEGLAFLRKEAPFGSAVRPHLVLLDLNMPRKDGFDVLVEMKTDKNLLSIPVFVYTSSEAEQDVRRAYQLHANGYLVKPISFSELVELARLLTAFWLEKVTGPP